MAARCVCGGCERMFASLASFDKHRTGSFSRKERRCMSEQEMTAHGLAVNTVGIWYIAQSHERMEHLRARV